MSCVKYVNKEALETMLSFQFIEYEKKYSKPEEAKRLNDCLTSLILRAHEQTKLKVVVLIDEHDIPLLNVMHEKSTYRYYAM